MEPNPLRWVVHRPSFTAQNSTLGRPASARWDRHEEKEELPSPITWGGATPLMESIKHQGAKRASPHVASHMTFRSEICEAPGRPASAAPPVFVGKLHPILRSGSARSTSSHSSGHEEPDGLAPSPARASCSGAASQWVLHTVPPGSKPEGYWQLGSLGPRHMATLEWHHQKEKWLRQKSFGKAAASALRSRPQPRPNERMKGRPDAGGKKRSESTPGARVDEKKGTVLGASEGESDDEAWRLRRTAQRELRLVQALG